jgi:serine phosphatase RsbU (regulator of sigma subunit)
MSPRHRLIAVVCLTAVVLGSASAFTLSRMTQWHRRGWIGAAYSPVFPGQKVAQTKNPYGAEPGEILMTYRGSPADGRLLSRDVVVSINGVPIDDVHRLRALDARLSRDAKVVYRVQRGGNEIDVPLHFDTPLKSPYIVIKAIIAFTVAAVFIFVALIVFARRPDDRRATVFFAFSLVSAVAILGSTAAVYDNAAGRGIVMTFGAATYASVVLFLFSIAYAPLILHLSLIFPKERPIVSKRPWILRWIYAGALLAALICVAVGILFVAMLRSGSADAPYWFGYMVGRLTWAFTVAALLLALLVVWLGRGQGVVKAFARRPFLAVIAFFGVYIALISLMPGKKLTVLAGLAGALLPLAVLASYPVLAVIALVRSYRSAGVEEKKQVQWPLWGLLIAVTVKIVCFVTAGAAGTILSAQHNMIAWRALFNALDLLPPIVTLLIPLSFAAAILKYRLMNIDVIIRKTVVYAMLSAVIVAAYVALVGGLGSFLVYAFGLENQTTMIIGSTLVVALAFVPLRNKLQTLVDRNLFRQKYDYPEALRAIATEARNAGDPGVFLPIAAEKLQQALQNRAVVIFAERQEELVATAKIGVSDSLLGRLRVPRAFLDQFDRPFDPRRRNVGDAVASALSRIEASLIVPAGSRGFLAFAPKLSAGEFDVEDIDFLRQAADEIAAALNRIRMQADEHDFAQARAIQQTLLPREIPRIPKLEVSGTWQPARTMGGDYYDVLKLSDSEVAICIGDVAGKGMPAALLMSALQAAVRASASNSPRDLCERVRRVVVSSLSGGRFVTFFYATLDTDAMTLRWCNAGHNAPILARADGTLVRLEEGGPAISRLFRDAGYSEREIALLPGDRLVLFTDGVSEATDAANEILGESRIEELVIDARSLAAAKLQQTIVDAAVSHSGGDLEDDLTLVVAAVEA